MKRIIVISIIILLIILIILGFYKIISRKNDASPYEIIPEEEISSEQLRQTTVSLYFKNGNQLLPEARNIDVKELLDDPYEKIIKMLIEGPKNNNLEKTIPEDTKINKVEKKEDILIIDLSEEFINNHVGGETEENLTIKSIVNTITELTEINKIKILIKGEENKGFKDNIVSFNNEFERE